MFRLLNNKITCNLESELDFYLLEKISPYLSSFSYISKIQEKSRIRKEDQKKDKENIFLNVRIDSVTSLKEEIRIEGLVTNHWIKKKTFIFKKGQEVQLYPCKKIPQLYLDLFNCQFDRQLYIVSFFHQILSVRMLTSKEVILIKEKEFKYKEYYKDIEDYLVPVLEGMILEKRRFLLLTSDMIKAQLDNMKELIRINPCQVVTCSEFDNLDEISKKISKKDYGEFFNNIKLDRDLKGYYFDKRFIAKLTPEDLYLSNSKIHAIFLDLNLFYPRLEEFYYLLSNNIKKINFFSSGDNFLRSISNEGVAIIKDSHEY